MYNFSLIPGKVFENLSRDLFPHNAVNSWWTFNDGPQSSQIKFSWISIRKEVESTASTLPLEFSYSPTAQQSAHKGISYLRIMSKIQIKLNGRFLHLESSTQSGSWYYVFFPNRLYCFPFSVLLHLMLNVCFQLFSHEIILHFSKVVLMLVVFSSQLQTSFT